MVAISLLGRDSLLFGNRLHLFTNSMRHPSFLLRGNARPSAVHSPFALQSTPGMVPMTFQPVRLLHLKHASSHATNIREGTLRFTNRMNIHLPF
jgi:hypothetical protein